jgi:hypothetical protein
MNAKSGVSDLGKINRLQRRASTFENVILCVLAATATIIIFVVKAPDKWLAAVYDTVCVFGGMISFFRLRWRYRQFWRIVAAAFAVHLGTAWLIFAVILRDRTDISLAICVPFIFFEGAILYYSVRFFEPKLPGQSSRAVKKGF